MRILHANFFIRLRSWEYWPFGIVQLPLFIYWIWLAIKARSLTFFTASNPGIFMGGMFGESKYDILSRVPDPFAAKSALAPRESTESDVLLLMKESGLDFPVIFKPDIGERGYLVKRIENADKISSYLNEVTTDFIVQEYLDLPVELGIFYTRFPNEAKGKVTSVVMKEMLSVTGDGRKSLKELIFTKDRAKLQWELLQERFKDQLGFVPASGERFVLNEIGNHCLGTKFLDGNELINNRLSEVFDSLSKQIDGFYFGRYDLRAASIEELYNGNFKVMELNGCGAEPAHIYQPGYPLSKALSVQFKHWSDMYAISRQNRNRGVQFVTLVEGIRIFREFRRTMS